VLEVEKIDAEAGSSVELSEVLLVGDGDEVTVGSPLVSGAKVSATVVEQARGAKITVFKYKPKVRYRRKIGHRQPVTRLRIDAINA
jgi:large subunit ribosomal protein L21